ncbi:hypothetical protein D081_1498 [Anaerovibrio sp. JC8]|uniref:hypothetical protein n=1 Tax=Anaerovibrio sp. JC8 TaxID=1240085 RepID=UPI000A0DED04|nr:hypothetical protein [Anaerovibrio sp. JC8]ORT99917.1 hypothetical protein D081_1498 [Anaerovibrio sp. JC8]
MLKKMELTSYELEKVAGGSFWDDVVDVVDDVVDTVDDVVDDVVDVVTTPEPPIITIIDKVS